MWNNIKNNPVALVLLIAVITAGIYAVYDSYQKQRALNMVQQSVTQSIQAMDKIQNIDAR